VLSNFKVVITTYEEPDEYIKGCHCEEFEKQIGVSALLSGEKITLEPKDLKRNVRKRNLSK